MTDELTQLSAQLPGSGIQGSGILGSGKNPARPPVHLWQPELSGDIDILICSDGTWIHEGRPIQRHSLVKLFASILRREADGHHYLVTPVEKWRLQVELTPLVIIDFEIHQPGTASQELWVTSNTGLEVCVNQTHPLLAAGELAELSRGKTQAAVIKLDNGLLAMFNRAAWYRLVEVAETRNSELGISSCGEFYPLG